MVAEISGASTIGAGAAGGAAVRVATFAVRGPAAAGRGRGSGISPFGGAAHASPVRRATAANAKMSRTAFTGTTLPPRRLPSAIEGKVIGRRIKKTPKASQASTTIDESRCEKTGGGHLAHICSRGGSEMVVARGPGDEGL